MRASRQEIERGRLAIQGNISLQQSTPESAEVRVLRVVNFDNTPWVDPRANELTVNFNFFLCTNDCEGKKRLGKMLGKN